MRVDILDCTARAARSIAVQIVRIAAFAMQFGAVVAKVGESHLDRVGDSNDEHSLPTQTGHHF